MAFTLLEVLLVLCLLMVAAAVAWPSLVKPLANQRVLKGADQVRTEWNRARVQAMKTGQTFVFRYSPNANQFGLECQAGPEASEATQNGTSSGASATGGNSASRAGISLQTHKLPKGVRFLVAQVESDSRSDQAASTESSAGASNEKIASSADPIYFYPDGTTSTAGSA